MSGVHQVEKVAYWHAFAVSDARVTIRHNLWLCSRQILAQLAPGYGSLKLSLAKPGKAIIEEKHCVMTQIG